MLAIVALSAGFSQPSAYKNAVNSVSRKVSRAVVRLIRSAGNEKPFELAYTTANGPPALTGVWQEMFHRALPPSEESIFYRSHKEMGSAT